MTLVAAVAFFPTDLIAQFVTDFAQQHEYLLQCTLINIRLSLHLNLCAEFLDIIGMAPEVVVFNGLDLPDHAIQVCKLPVLLRPSLCCKRLG